VNPVREVTIQQLSPDSVTVTVPNADAPYHIILEVRDNDPAMPLYSYRRAIIRVGDAARDR
jgi:hypothetical protein